MDINKSYAEQMKYKRNRNTRKWKSKSRWSILIKNLKPHGRDH